MRYAPVVLIRCARCRAVFSVQEGLSGPVQRAFKVECGRCLAVFEAQAGQVPEGPRTPPPRRIPTPAPLQKALAVALPAAAALAVERHAMPEEMADMGPLRPAIYGPVARHNPLTVGGGAALAVLAIIALVAFFVLNRPRVPSEAAAKAEQARAALLLDDDASLEQAASLFGEAAKVSPGAPSFEADRAYALLLRGSALQDVAERLEPLARTSPSATAERETDLREGGRLVQEGAAAAQAALEQARDELPALRAMALAAALTSGSPQHWLEAADRHGPDDPLVAYARATAELAGGRTGEAQERALSALTAARQAEPRLLRAQVEAAVVALDRHDLAAARQSLQGVVEANPRHERAKRLLSLVPP